MVNVPASFLTVRYLPQEGTARGRGVYDSCARDMEKECRSGVLSLNKLVDEI